MNKSIAARNREADESWASYQQNGKFVDHESMAAWLDAWGTEQEGTTPGPETRY